MPSCETAKSQLPYGFLPCCCGTQSTSLLSVARIVLPDGVTCQQVTDINLPVFLPALLMAVELLPVHREELGLRLSEPQRELPDRAIAVLGELGVDDLALGCVRLSVGPV